MSYRLIEKPVILMIEIDNTTYAGFGICMIGLILIILFGIALPQREERLFIKIRAIGTLIAMVGGLILLTKIVI